VVVGEDEDLILGCYWLARLYHQNPEVFLDMPLSAVRKHLARTIQVAELMQAESEDG
jgi:hypothetical protein